MRPLLVLVLIAMTQPVGGMTVDIYFDSAHPNDGDGSASNPYNDNGRIDDASLVYPDNAVFHVAGRWDGERAHQWRFAHGPCTVQQWAGRAEAQITTALLIGKQPATSTGGVVPGNSWQQSGDDWSLDLSDVIARFTGATYTPALFAVAEVPDPDVADDVPQIGSSSITLIPDSNTAGQPQYDWDSGTSTLTISNLGDPSLIGLVAYIGDADEGGIFSPGDESITIDGLAVWGFGGSTSNTHRPIQVREGSIVRNVRGGFTLSDFIACLDCDPGPLVVDCQIRAPMGDTGVVFFSDTTNVYGRGEAILVDPTHLPYHGSTDPFAGNDLSLPWSQHTGSSSGFKVLSVDWVMCTLMDSPVRPSGFRAADSDIPSTSPRRFEDYPIRFDQCYFGDHDGFTASAGGAAAVRRSHLNSWASTNLGINSQDGDVEIFVESSSVYIPAGASGNQWIDTLGNRLILNLVSVRSEISSGAWGVVSLPKATSHLTFERWLIDRTSTDGTVRAMRTVDENATIDDLNGASNDMLIWTSPQVNRYAFGDAARSTLPNWQSTHGSNGVYATDPQLSGPDYSQASAFVPASGGALAGQDTGRRQSVITYNGVRDSGTYGANAVAHRRRAHGLRRRASRVRGGR